MLGFFSQFKNEYSPVGGDHGGVIADPPDPGGRACPRVDHRGVGVVVDPLLVTRRTVGQDGPHAGGCSSCLYQMGIAVGKPLIQL